MSSWDTESYRTIKGVMLKYKAQYECALTMIDIEGGYPVYQVTGPNRLHFDLELIPKEAKIVRAAMENDLRVMVRLGKRKPMPFLVMEFYLNDIGPCKCKIVSTEAIKGIQRIFEQIMTNKLRISIVGQE